MSDSKTLRGLASEFWKSKVLLNNFTWCLPSFPTQCWTWLSNNRNIRITNVEQCPGQYILWQTVYTLHLEYFAIFFLKCLEGISPFYFGSWYPLQVTSALYFISRMDSALACFITYLQWIPQIYLWCNTCWLLDGQHGGRDFLIFTVCVFAQLFIQKQNSPTISGGGGGGDGVPCFILCQMPLQLTRNSLLVVCLSSCLPELETIRLNSLHSYFLS